MVNIVPLKKQSKRAQKEFHSKRELVRDIARDTCRAEWEDL